MLASLTGTLAGVGLGYGLIALIDALASAVPMGAAELPVPWLLGGFAVGLVVTMVASWLPTRRVVLVSPLAALRPDAGVDARTCTGLARPALAALLLVTGLALLGVAMVRSSTALMLAGGGSVFAGVLLFGPVLVPRLVRIAGAPLGPTGRLAARTPSVERAIPVYGAVAQVAGLHDPIPVVTAPSAGQVARDGGVFARVEPGKIRIDSDAFGKGLTLRPGDRVTVRVGDRRAQLQVAVGTGWGPTGVVAPETLATLTDAPEPHAVWIRASTGADPARLGADLDELADPVGATIENGLRTWESLDQQLQIYTWSALGLLGIAVVIALIGIANTLGLSVLERAREHAMLRALGLTRRQLRRMLAIEAVLLSLVATVLGTVLGVGFAWVGYETFVTRALRDATMQVPWLSLVVVLIAALAGLLAAVLPARRAARVTPAAGLSLD